MPYLVACELFDAPLSPGLFCVDLFFVFTCFFCKRSIFWQFLFSVPCILLICLGNGSYGVVTGIYYLLLVWGSFFAYHRAKIRFITCFILALGILLGEWSLFFEAAFSLSLGDLWGISKFFWWGIVLFFLVPAAQIGLVYFLSRRFLFEKKNYLKPLLTFGIVAGLFSIHFVSGSIQSRQSILDFSVYSFAKQQLQPGRTTQSSILRQDAKEAFSIGNDHQSLVSLDSIRPTVVILVESWGLRKNFQTNVNEFAVFEKNKVSFLGIWLRQANFTQGAELEDFGFVHGEKPDETLMDRYRSAGYDTWFVHGFDGNFYERAEKYGTYGFSKIKFNKELVSEGLPQCHYGNVGFEGICDSSMIGYIDKLLVDSLPKFIYWTTLDSHPPYETQTTPESDICSEMNNVECIHAVRIRNTLKGISVLAEKHPNYRFILRGDHRPMGSLTANSFVSSFYHRWVPMVVLN